MLSLVFFKLTGSFSRKCLLNTQNLNNHNLSFLSSRNGVPWSKWLVQLATQTIRQVLFPWCKYSTPICSRNAYGISWFPQGCKMLHVLPHNSCILPHCCAFWALRLLFNSFSFVSFLVNSCKFSLPTVFIKLSFFLPSSNFLHLISFRKRNQITKHGWKFV